jgi:serine protease Do
VEIDGRKIERASQVKEAISRRYAGDTLRVVISRDDQRIERELELAAELEPYERPLLGILPMRRPSGSDGRSSGVKVRYVYPESPAAAAGLQRGDVLLTMEGQPIEGPGRLRGRISQRQPGDEVAIAARRGQETLPIKARLGRLPEGLPPDALPPARDAAEPHGGDRPGAALPNAIAPDRPQSGPVQLKIPELANDAWAYVPERYDAAVPHGLVVWLQGPGAFDWQGVLAAWKSLCDGNDLILLAPKPATPDGWQLGEVALVQKLIDEVRSAYTVDPVRIVLHGHRAGGRLAYLVARTSPDVVRAVAAVEAPMAVRPPEHDPLYPMAFYVAWAKASPDADAIRASVRRLREMKYPVTVKRLGEESRYLRAEELSELVRWIDVLDRI